MNVVKWSLLSLLTVLSLSKAHAATCSVPSGASAATIQASLNACGSGNTEQLNGTYALSTALTVPCGVSLAGPATLNLSNGALVAFSSCSVPVKVSGLTCNAGRPSPDGGLCFYFPAGTSNLTFTGNTVYGNQANASQGKWNDALVLFDGNSTSPVDTNDTVSNNTFGASGDCSNVMSNYTYAGLGGDGGYCTGLSLHDGFSSLLVTNNTFSYQEEGIKVFEGQGECLDCILQYNDFSYIHRIPIETQANISTTMTIQYNSVHDQYDPNFGSWGISASNGCASCVTNTRYNLLINNVQATSAGQYTPGAIEVWGSQGTAASGNVIQGDWANGIQTSSTGQFTYNDNKFCMGVGGSTTFPGKGGYLNDETSNPQSGVPTGTGNTFQTTNCPQTSVAPKITPSGTFTTSQTVTLSNPGQGMDLNTSIWYTTDGTTPIPGKGTAQLYTAPFSVAKTITVNAVGMWGAPNQPTSYAPGYGYVPSAVQSATYTLSAPVTPPVPPTPPAPTAPVCTSVLNGTTLTITCTGVQ